MAAPVSESVVRIDERLCLALIIGFGIALRIWNVFYAPSLWMDEAFSAKLAESPLHDLLLAVPRFDTHPPLYYVQLHFWARLGSGDAWLILNSALFDILAILSLAYTVGQLHGRQAGLWVAAVYAVLPLGVFFAENVRMYTLFFLLVVWLWYLLERRVGAGHASGSARAGALALGIAATLTHGLGFFVVFFVYLQATVRTYERRDSSGARPAAAIVMDYLPVALAAGYAIGIGSFRQTEGLADFDLASIGIHLAISLLGMEVPAPAIAGYIAFALILLPPLSGRDSRVVLAWLVLAPFATLLLLSLTVKTVFMYRTLGLFLPFIAIAAGLFYAEAWRSREARKQAASGIFLVALALAAVNSSVAFEKAGYREAAALWDREAADDAVLFVDGPINLWGVTRYLPSSPQFSALAIQPPVRDGLLRLKERLQGSYIDRAGFFGQSDHLLLKARQIWPYRNEKRLDEVSTYWVLSPTGKECLRPTDTLVREFDATGHHLLECKTSRAGRSA